jgi:hypothetical protein
MTKSLVSLPQCFSRMSSLISCTAFLVIVSQHHSPTLLEKGLSSPTVNLAWERLHLVIGYILFRVGKMRAETTQSLLFSSQAWL